MKNFLIITIIFICLSQANLIGQVSEWNLDFEEWDLSKETTELWHDTTIVENRVGMFPPNWHHRTGFIHESTGLGRTTDATNGNYAVALSGFYSYEVMRIISGEDPENSGWPINFRPHELIGDYKSILLGSCDSLRTYIDVFLTKYDFLKERRDTIGNSSIILKESDYYKNFKLDINYSVESIIPDTVIIVLAKQRFGFDVPPVCLECSHVFFDNLKLNSVVSTTNSTDPVYDINIYPNPSNEYLSINSNKLISKVEIIDVNGIKQFSVDYNNKIELSNLMTGLFILRIIYADGTQKLKTFIKY
ncbi:MAG: T9SS type A sorting domain-containing protein [Chlorobiota bacterium]